MNPQDLDLAAALRQVLRHPLIRDELHAVVAEVAGVQRPQGEAFLSVAEAARRASVKPPALRAWIRAGTLAAGKVPGGRGWRVRAADLEALLAGQAGSAPVLDLDARRETRAQALVDAVRRPSRGE